MGKSYINISIEKALSLSEDWEVATASKEVYFTNKKWRSNVVSAQIEEDSGEIIFTTPNEDFIQVEKGD